MNKQITFNKWLVLIWLVSVLYGCKSAEISMEGPDKKWSTAQIIRAHNQAQSDFKTLSARAQLTIDTQEKKQKISLSLRMLHQDTIWVKASVFGVTLAKGVLTPDRVQFYESLTKSYYDGSFQALRQWLGLPLDYAQVERLLLGQSIVPLTKHMGHSIHDKHYQLGPVNLDENLVFSTEIRPQDYKIGKADLRMNVPNQSLRITYPSYHKDTHISPEEIVLTSKGAQVNTTIMLSLKNIEYGRKIRFPYLVPEGFKRLNLAL